MLNAVSEFQRQSTQGNEGVLSNFKGYCQRQTFQNLIDKNDGQGKISIRENLKNNNIMVVVDNKNFSGMRRNVWKDYEIIYGQI